MKKVFMAGLLVILTLWFGYSFGYQQGLHEEGKAWRATASVDRDPASRALRISYRDPRARLMIAHSSGMNVINVPDPRVYRQYEQSSP